VKCLLAGFVALMLAAGREIFKNQSFAFNHLVIEYPLELDMKKSTPIELYAKSKEGGYEATVYTLKDSHTWIPHAKSVFSRLKPGLSPKIEWKKLRGICNKCVNVESFNNQLAESGQYKGKFPYTFRKIWISDNEVIAELESDLELGLIDGSLQVLSTLFKKDSGIYLPVSIDYLDCYLALGSSIRMHGILREVSDQSLTADIEFISLAGELLMKIRGFQAKKKG